MSKYHISILLLFLSRVSFSQNSADLPYRTIPDYPNSYTAGAVTARMVDGLGFRYYWATEGLRNVDLEFRPSPDARTTSETLDHILDLTTILANTVQKQPHKAIDKSELSFEQKRRLTLANIKLAADILSTASEEDLTYLDIVFQNENASTTFPFWNMLNGPISDALWHVGQVVSFRRSSGNPFNSKASVLTGKVRD